MSTRYEGAAARHTTIWVAPAGEELGADAVPDGEIALCLNYDEAFILSGTPAELEAFLLQALDAVRAHRP